MTTVISWFGQLFHLVARMNWRSNSREPRNCLKFIISGVACVSTLCQCWRRLLVTPRSHLMAAASRSSLGTHWGPLLPSESSVWSVQLCTGHPVCCEMCTVQYIVHCHCSQLRAVYDAVCDAAKCCVHCALRRYLCSVKCALCALACLCALKCAAVKGVQWTWWNAPIIAPCLTCLALHITHNLHCFDSLCYADSNLTNQRPVHFAFYSVSVHRPQNTQYICCLYVHITLSVHVTCAWMLH